MFKQYLRRVLNKILGWGEVIFGFLRLKKNSLVLYFSGHHLYRRFFGEFNTPIIFSFSFLLPENSSQKPNQMLPCSFLPIGTTSNRLCSYSFFAKIEPSQDTSPFGKTATKRPELANSTIKYPLYTTHHHKTTLTRPKTTIVAIPDHQTTAKSPSFLAPAKDS